MITIAAANISPVTADRPVQRDDIQERALAAAAAAASKKGEDIVILDVGPILAITDFFVIASGANDRQVKTVVDEVERQLRDHFSIVPLRIEGAEQRQWVLMDYGDFWVHVFLDETRRYYELERLWSDAARVPFEDPTLFRSEGRSGPGSRSEGRSGPGSRSEGRSGPGSRSEGRSGPEGAATG